MEVSIERTAKGRFPVKQWMLASVAWLGFAPMAHASAMDRVDDCADSAIGWCEAVAHRVASIQPGADVRQATAVVRAYAASARPASPRWS